MVRDIIASGNGCKVWEYEEMGISGNGNGIGMKWIWYKWDAWTVESGLISERMEDGIYKV